MYKDANGNVQFAYDFVHLDGGHTFCAECAFQLRVFGGVEFARIGQNLTGTFQSPDGSALSADTTTSLFTGAGPRVGLKGQYASGRLPVPRRGRGRSLDRHVAEPHQLYHARRRHWPATASL